MKAAEGNKWTSGSTAVFVVLKNNKLYLGNVGDSEAVLGKKKQDGDYDTILISKKHRPTEREEMMRIIEAGGYVDNGRVQGSLEVSRAFGDIDLKWPHCCGTNDFVIARPFVNELDVEEGDVVILACDGLWDVMSYEEVIEFIVSCKNEDKSPDETVKLLIQKALDEGTTDNITAIVVYIESKQ
eukprot:TRINITY_DN3295_c0_g1_i3.p1 TRINITY_DN3295_c0_g1~~TRINITY_DN3295_c0_g1_i3.p1  ORF type:complete len:184 (-),score=51.97 TRINITY_DN3295_c0_g1_i3:1-552(-)